MNGSLFPQLEPHRDETHGAGRSISFTVLGIPKAQGRARAFVMPGTKHIRMYDPADSKSWKQEVRAAASAAMKDSSLLEGPLKLTAVFFLPRPGRLVWKTRPMPAEPCDKKPDLDNLIKAVKDALKGVIWRDDAQVASFANSEKRYAAGPGFGDERARVEVTVEVIQ